MIVLGKESIKELQGVKPLAASGKTAQGTQFNAYCVNDSHTILEIRLCYLNFINYGYIIIDNLSHHAVIVDPAWELTKIVDILNYFHADLTTILLTHSHFDHTNLVKPLLHKFKPNVYISKTESEFYGYNCENLNLINHLDKIRVGATEFTCLLTPGHTHGGVCYLLDDALFTGDTIFIEGCGVCDGYGASPSKMFGSVRLLERIINPEVLVFPGHSYGLTPGCDFRHILENNIYFHFKTEDSFTAFRMRPDQPKAMGFK